MFKALLRIILFILLFTGVSHGQTIYGVTGIIKTPNAYIVDTGKCVLGSGYFKDYYGDRKTLYDQWTVNLNIGFHSRFELGVRLAAYPGSTGGDSKIYSVGFDRIFNGKFILIKEKHVIPQIAVGVQDAVGTRYHNSTYITGSKNIQIKNNFNIVLSSGYGENLDDKILGKARNHDFIGYFGGAEIGFKKKIYLMGEYDARDFNSGGKDDSLPVAEHLLCNDENGKPIRRAFVKIYNMRNRSLQHLLKESYNRCR